MGGAFHSNQRRFRAGHLCLLLFVFLGNVLAMAQETGRASIRGVVRDEQGVPVADASLVLKNNKSGASAAATTDVKGTYAFTALPAGAYTLHAAKTGLGEA